MPAHAIAAQLKAHRKAQKLSRQAVAESAGISPTTVERFEAGANVGFDAVTSIATVLGGELRYAPVDTIPAPTATRDAPAAAPIPPLINHLGPLRWMATQADVDAYTRLRARFEDGERFDAVLESLRTEFNGPSIGRALVILAQRLGLPSSREIRALCQ